MALILLALAISSGAAGTISLRLASERTKAWWAGVLVGYMAAYTLLILSLAKGMPLSSAYGIWAACSVGVTAILSWLFFKERFTWMMGVGLVLIVGGVLLIELGTATGPVSAKRLVGQVYDLRQPIRFSRSHSLQMGGPTHRNIRRVSIKNSRKYL